MPITRFAPSPSGYLHLGHAYAALFAKQAAAGSTCLLRIEDLDHTRCKAEYTDALVEDLAWLGLAYPKPYLLQSTRNTAYQAALLKLQQQGLLYRCCCTRKELQQSAPQGPREGKVQAFYPGTCRHLSIDEAKPFSWRLNAQLALQQTGPLFYRDAALGIEPQPVLPEQLEDVVLARKELGTSYHLAVVVDDAAQGVELVTRGMDLQICTPLHRLLQALLDLPETRWHHHPLILDEAGNRLAKRDAAKSLRQYRAAGTLPSDLIEQLGIPLHA